MSKFEAMKKANGRFFTVGLTNGKRISAKFESESPEYVRVHDQNAKESRKFKKTSVAFIQSRGVVFQ